MQVLCFRMARLLLLLTAVLLAVMPSTEHVSNWDNGFRGGQDCEFGLLALAAVLGLALLPAQRVSESERAALEQTTDSLATAGTLQARRAALGLAPWGNGPANPGRLGAPAPVPFSRRI